MVRADRSRHPGRDRSGHVVGEDGTRYLFTSGVRRIQLADDGLSTVGELEKVYDGWRYPDEWITESYALEGPKLFWRASASVSGRSPRTDPGFIYLVSAVGGTGGPPDRPHGDRRAVALGGRALGEPSAQPDRPHRGCVRGAGGRAGTRRLVPGPAGSVDDDWWMVVARLRERIPHPAAARSCSSRSGGARTTGPRRLSATSADRSKRRSEPPPRLPRTTSPTTSRGSNSAGGGPSMPPALRRRSACASKTAS